MTIFKSIYPAIIIAVLLAPPLWSAAELPPEFGSKIPVYDTAEPVDTRYTREGVTVQFSTKENFNAVRGFYAEHLQVTGWRVLERSAGKPLIAVNKKCRLTLKETPESPGFIIDLAYPEGRE
ncbi:MAG: hypothetical protein HUN04_22065 [Desulfobacter sp.]|nr:MAG: hypothetical protein HUN04_22065 [Desulfobacter sp.]